MGDTYRNPVALPAPDASQHLAKCNQPGFTLSSALPIMDILFGPEGMAMGYGAAGYKNREARRQVLIACRMKSVRGWGDASIHNISSRGLMIACDDPLEPGEYVDIRRGRQVVIGRVIWKRDRFSGIRTQDVISADALVNEPRLESRPAPRDAGNERRHTRQHMVSEIDTARRIERSRAISGTLQFGALGLFGIVAAATIAVQVGHVLDQPTQQIEQALSAAR